MNSSIIQIIFSLLITDISKYNICYKVIHNGKTYECKEYRYDEVGCINFNNGDEDIKICNNFILIKFNNN
jgi:hypothetical protein